MRWPLFAKIFLSVCLSFIAATQVVWVIDSMLQANPSRTAERTARLALSSLSTALRLGGEPELRRELATWPALERQHLTFQRVENGLPPAQDPLHGVFSIVARRHWPDTATGSPMSCAVSTDLYRRPWPSTWARMFSSAPLS